MHQGFTLPTNLLAANSPTPGRRRASVASGSAQAAAILTPQFAHLPGKVLLSCPVYPTENDYPKGRGSAILKPPTRSGGQQIETRADVTVIRGIRTLINGWIS